jgi:hypothetical protein
MSDKFYIIGEDGEEQLVSYEDLDEQAIDAALKPLAGFVFSGDAFLRLKLVQSPFYIKDWLPHHARMMMFGGAKAGKSVLAVQLARCIALGEPFLGMQTNPGRVLYLQHELGIETLQERVRKTGQTYENVFFGTTFSMPLDTTGGQKILADTLDAVQPQVLIIDPVYKVISGDENEAHDMMQVTNFLDSMLELHESDGLSIVLMHHMGKDPDRGGRGSSIWEGWVDSYLAISRVSAANEPVLRSRITPKLLRHAAMPPEPINIVMGDNMEFDVGEAALKVVDKLLKFAKEHDKFKMQEVIDGGIGSRKSVYDARNELLKAGRLTPLDGNFYQYKEGV